MALVLSELWIYPLKSARGIRLTEASLTSMGLRYDRRWLLVDQQGKFLSQRELPKLARLEVSLSEHQIMFRCDGSELTLPLQTKNLNEIEVNVWRSFVSAQLFPEEIHAWFSQQLDYPCQLVYMPDSTVRETNPEYAAGKRVSFADGYPYLLTHESSLSELNQRLEKAIPMDRFRPNLVVSGAEAFAEATWARLRVGNHLFINVKPCERCIITTIDQKTAEIHQEPLRTLAQHYSHNGKVIFGQNLVTDSLVGTLKIGDPVEIVSQKEEHEL